MARPGFVLEVDDRTPPLVVNDGPRVRLERFPLGTEVLYPAESLARIDDLAAGIDAALAAPVDAEPLTDKLRPGMKLTIAFDDVSSTPPMRAAGQAQDAPDVRGRIIERVLMLAAAAGVDDVSLVCANGLNRRNTEAELRLLLGERVFRSFYADGKLTNHDAETAGPDTGDLNPRVAASDLLIFVHIARGLAADAAGTGAAGVTIGQGAIRDGGLAAAAAGLSSVDVIRTGGVPAGLEALDVFSVDAVLDNEHYPSAVDFLGRREWEWSLKSQAKLLGLRRATSIAPWRSARALSNRLGTGYGVTRVTAGAPQAVAEASRERVLEQQQVEVSGQADVLVVGVPAVTAHSVGSVTNPVLAAWQALGVSLRAVTGDPLVRDGGAVIVYHPLAADFSTLHHPSTVDFFADVLPASTDSSGIGPQPETVRQFESKFAEDPWYDQLYRTSQAFHGLHPFRLWYQLSAAVERVGDVIFVGADRDSAARLGFRAASTLADALEITSATVGRSPKIRYLHTPPNALGAVR